MKGKEIHYERLWTLYLHIYLEQWVLFLERSCLPEELVNLEDDLLFFVPDDIKDQRVYIRILDMANGYRYLIIWKAMDI